MTLALRVSQALTEFVYKVKKLVTKNLEEAHTNREPRALDCRNDYQSSREKDSGNLKFESTGQASIIELRKIPKSYKTIH
jgi:hypothetical protein